MVRTQVYLTENETHHLDTIAEVSGINQSRLIRQAIDRLIEDHAPSKRLSLIQSGFGLWKERTDIPDLSDLREGWARRSNRMNKDG